MREEFRPFFGGAYEVSNMGTVRRAKPGRKTWAGRVLKHTIMTIGYPCVRPVKDGKNVMRTVHSLVAEAFLGPRRGREVNHIDGNKANPRLDNLEYVSHAGNMRHASRTGLLRTGENHPSHTVSDADVEAIRRAQSAGMSYGQICTKWHVSLATVSDIVNRATRKNVAPDVVMGRKPTGPVGSRNASAKMSDDKVRSMRAEFEAGSSRSELALKYRLSYTTTAKILNRSLWRHV